MSIIGIRRITFSFMPAKKKSAVQKLPASQSKAAKRMHSLQFSVIALVLLVLGVGSALILSQQSQDTRSSAAFISNAPKPVVQQATQPTLGVGNAAQQTTKPMLGVGNAAQQQQSPKPLLGVGNAAQQQQTTKVELGVGKAAQQQAQQCDLSIWGKCILKASDQKSTQQTQAETKKTDNTKNTGSSAASTGSSGGTGGSSGSTGTTAATSAEIAFTQQLYRELIGTVPPQTDKDFLTNVENVRNNNCLAVVQSFNYNDTFKQRKQSYSNYQYARMIHRALVSRTFDPDSASNGWVAALDGGMTKDQLAVSIWSHEEPKVACAQRRMLAN